MTKGCTEVGMENWRSSLFLGLILLCAFVSFNAQASAQWRPVYPGLGQTQMQQHLPFRPAPRANRYYSASPREMRSKFYQPRLQSAYRPVAAPPMMPHPMAMESGRFSYPVAQRYRPGARQPMMRPEVPMFARQYGWRPAVNPWVVAPARQVLPRVAHKPLMRYNNDSRQFRPVTPRMGAGQNMMAMYRPVMPMGVQRQIGPWGPSSQEMASVHQSPFMRPIPVYTPATQYWSGISHPGDYWYYSALPTRPMSYQRQPNFVSPPAYWAWYEPAQRYYPGFGPANLAPHFQQHPQETWGQPQNWWAIDLDGSDWQASCYNCME